ncbi:MAG: NAD(+)/NADH kinase [Candidatus Woesearchaeota archaeon]|nr:NAD(+)/NADH kinase [Candidatus Woesearchaeota archaeon]
MKENFLPKNPSCLVVFIENAPKKALRTLSSILKKRDFNYSFVPRKSISNLKEKAFSGFDLVLTLGGDGTFLSSAHFNRSLPVLGINLNPSEKEGFFTRSRMKNIDSDIENLICGRFHILNLLRLEARINQKTLPELALNDIFFGAEKAYHACRYVISMDGKSEEQRSSGIIASTPAGSNAWLLSAGGKRLPLSSHKIQFLVREPYSGRLTKPKIRAGFFEKIKFSPLKNFRESIIVFDSVSIQLQPCRTEFHSSAQG